MLVGAAVYAAPEARRPPSIRRSDAALASRSSTSDRPRATSRPTIPRGWRLGGGVTYAALTTARLGLRTAAVVGVDREASRAHELDAMRDAGVDILAGRSLGGADLPQHRDAPGPAPGVDGGRRAGPSLACRSSWMAAAAAGRSSGRRRGARRLGRRRPRRCASSAWPGRGCSGAWSRAATSSGSRPRPADPAAPTSSASATSTWRRTTSLGGPHGVPPPGARLLVTQGGHGGLLVTTGDDGQVEVLRYLPTPTSARSTRPGQAIRSWPRCSGLRPSVAASTRRSRIAGPRTCGSRPPPARSPSRMSARRRAGSDRRPDPAGARARPPRGRPEPVPQVGVEDPRQ